MKKLINSFRRIEYTMTDNSAPRLAIIILSLLLIGGCMTIPKHEHDWKTITPTHGYASENFPPPATIDECSICHKRRTFVSDNLIPGMITGHYEDLMGTIYPWSSYEKTGRDNPSP